MLRAIARTNRNTPNDDDAWLAIFDARSWTAATANKGQGGGFEDVTQMKNCTINFCDIGNIHAVRSCFNNLSLIPTCPANFNSVSVYGPLVEDSGYL